MNPIVFALRRPLTVMVVIAGMVLCSVFALSNLLPDQVRAWLPAKGMPVDIFPDLNTPVIYVAQPYGGMDARQMEGYLTYYFEYHFLYITGIHHVESKNIQGLALTKLVFHPGTNMGQAMAETVAQVNRARSFMPQGTVPPFIMRFDAGSVPVGYLVFSTDNPERTIGQIQFEALNRVRPMFAALEGVSAPPPFGGNQRTIVINLNRDNLNRYGMSPDEVARALAEDNQLSPSGNLQIGNQTPIVPLNSVVTEPKELEKIAIRKNHNPTVFLRDVGRVEDITDIPTGYGLVDGRRSVYIPVTKRADASTVSVVNLVRENLDKMQSQLPPDIRVGFDLDQSPYVTRAIRGVSLEAGLGAVLTGLMVLLFLRDWRSVIVVVLNIPLALLGAVAALWLSGQTVNLMTLGGLALAVGILVDEATVIVENMHTQMKDAPSIARAVRRAGTETAIPRLLAMLCVLAVFIPSFFMQGAARALFVPLSLAVGFAMVTSYLLSSTFVPVLSCWLLRHHEAAAVGADPSLFTCWRAGYARAMQGVIHLRWLLVPAYLGVAGLVLFGLYRSGRVGMEIFPAVDAGQFQLRLRAPEGTALERTEELTKRALDAIAQEAGGVENVQKSICLVGTASYNYPINSIYLWSAGSHEAILKVALKRGSGIEIDDLKERLRRRLPTLDGMRDVKLSFEAGDIVEDVMSFGAPARIEVAVNGPSLEDNRAYAEKLFRRLEPMPALRDLQYVQGLDYPTIKVEVDRERAGLSGVSLADVARALAPTTLSSRFTVPNYWADPKTGIAFQVQVQVSSRQTGSLEERIQELKNLPVKRIAEKQVLLGQVARVTPDKMPGEYDRYNMRRQVSITANIHGTDLAAADGQIAAAIDQLQAEDPPPRGVLIDIRGQIVPMNQMFQGLGKGLLLAIGVILLLLMANFQSFLLALVVISTIPAVIIGVAVALIVTDTTLNIQSFMGAIMAVGVAVANAILLVTFAERSRRAGADARAAAVDGAAYRLRPILMTSCAMIAGMMPMAWGLGEGGEQTAPLGRAVIGGLAAATLATLLILPAVFALVQGWATRRSPSLDPDDPQSAHYDSPSVQSPVLLTESLMRE